ncbi:hypothetical protein [Streptomyces sp. KL116D]|uniref:hypothetical protein n=1 Tax=Streptomyces sp. KL116D TaxID=3045152 RepID=UPI0035564B02
MSGALAVTASRVRRRRRVQHPSAGQDIAPAARAQLKRRRHSCGGRSTPCRRRSTPPGRRRRGHRPDHRRGSSRRCSGLDAQGRPQRDADYLEKAEVIETEPKQVVLYKLNQQAVRSDGREIGALTSPPSGVPWSGKDSAYWTAQQRGLRPHRERSSAAPTTSK